MMCWNWIDSSRKCEALTISCPTRHSVPSAVQGRAWTKNRENNPMQSRVDPGSQHSCCVRGRRKAPTQSHPALESRDRLQRLAGAERAQRRGVAIDPLLDDLAGLDAEFV